MVSGRPASHRGEAAGVWPLLVFVEAAGGRNMALGWSGLRVTHFGSFETSFHLRRLQQHGGEVALFTEDLWLRGWSCCGQYDWLSLWQGGAWAVMRSHGVRGLNPFLPPLSFFLGALKDTLFIEM